MIYVSLLFVPICGDRNDICQVFDWGRRFWEAEKGRKRVRFKQIFSFTFAEQRLNHCCAGSDDDADRRSRGSHEFDLQVNQFYPRS